MNQQAADGSGRSADKVNDLAFLPVLAGVSAIVFVLAYFIFFGMWRGAPAGGPEAWANFGDYFGGVVNPIIGVVTVLLVFFTLKATRIEAADTRQKMQDQLDALVTQQVLTDLHRRIEGIYRVWESLLAIRYVGLIGLDEHDQFFRANGNTFREIFNAVGFVEAARRWGAEGRNEPPPEIADHFRTAAATVSEMDLVLLQYKSIAKNDNLTDFYRLRLESAAEVLFGWSMVDVHVRNRFRSASTRMVEAQIAAQRMT